MYKKTLDSDALVLKSNVKEITNIFNIGYMLKYYFYFVQCLS